MRTILDKRRRQSESIRKMVITGMLSAITAILTFTPIGMIPLPPPLLSATTVHVPVLLAAVAEGPLVGMAVGLVFGLCSLIRAFQSPVGLTLFFQNPLVSVLPRVLFPLIAALLFGLWKKLPRQNAVTDKVGVGLCAAIGTLLNTFFCLSMVVVLYGNDLTALINNMISAGNAEAQYLDNAGAWLVAVVGVPNGVSEIIVAAILVPMLKAAVDAVTRRSGRKTATSPKKEQP